MNEMQDVRITRLVPQLPPVNEKLRLLIDTDAGTEIDDLYAIALALVSPDRFGIEGFIATHFATKAGPESIEKSVLAVQTILEVAGVQGKYPIKRSAHPMQYPGHPSQGEGVDFLIERAHAGSEENPLWVVCIGAATNLASAVLKDPTIIPKVRYVFHARSSHTWPERSVQYNVKGDILAARTLLASQVPLVWFDTGTDLRCSYEETEKHIAPTGALGKYIHEFRNNRPYFKSPEKAFFDMADFAWMVQPGLGKAEIVGAPAMDHCMFFDHTNTNGSMLRVYDIETEGTWHLMFDRLARYSEVIRQK